MSQTQKILADPHAEQVAAIIAALDALPPDERLKVFERYCVHCGDVAPLGCQCMNDD